MHDNRMTRRIAGALRKRVAEAGFEKIADRRDNRGKRWQLHEVLSTVAIGMMAGAKSFGELEERTTELEGPVRKHFGISRRLPDTTARTIICGLEPQALKPCLHDIVRAARRRKALRHDGLPFGVVALDGKGSAMPASDDWYAQRQSETPLVGVVRTITATLTSLKARPIIDVTPIPAHTNEMGWFNEAFVSLMQAYSKSDLFRLITYDAGATSLANADLVRAGGVHYCFALKGTQPSLFREAQRLLANRDDDDCDAVTEDADKTTRRLFIAAIDGWDEWNHLRVFVRVSSSAPGRSGETRYFISSLPISRLAATQWLRVIRQHWGVETSHQILDVAFQEDKRLWIEACPRGTATLMVLRRIAYTILTLFRSITQRSDDKRNTPWRKLLRSVALTLLKATAEDLASLPRHAVTVPS